MKNDAKAAHQYCNDNKPFLLNGEKCGCFYCLEIYTADEIESWVKDTKGTALCPYCGIDTVISESSGYPIIKEFLTVMKKYWFSKE